MIMKVLFFIALTGVYLTVSLVNSAPSYTERYEEENSGSNSSGFMYMSSSSPNEFVGATEKPAHCRIQLKHQDKINKVVQKCGEKKGFPGDDGNSTFVEFLEATDYDDNCFSKCVLKELDVSKNDGGKKLKKSIKEFAKLLKSNAKHQVEEQRIKSWKSCGLEMEKQISPKEIEKPAYCKAASKFLACGLKAQEEAYNNCH